MMDDKYDDSLIDGAGLVIGVGLGLLMLALIAAVVWMVS